MWTAAMLRGLSEGGCVGGLCMAAPACCWQPLAVPACWTVAAGWQAHGASALTAAWMQQLSAAWTWPLALISTHKW
jgi:hypothetical protein